MTTPHSTTPTNQSEQEYELNTEQCAKVALYMYEQWQEAMKPPLYAYYNFPTWLKRLTTHPNENGEE